MLCESQQNKTDGSMRIYIVSGSQVEGSQSARMAGVLKNRLLALGVCGHDDCQIQDLGTAPLPLWNKTAGCELMPQADFISRADGLILISPDWHGMATPALKNWFYFLPDQALEHKPVLLCGVSAGQGGLYPVMDLRAHSFKNFRPCYLPEHLLIRQVKSQFLHADSATDEQAMLLARTDYCLLLLQAYAAGFQQIRSALPERHPAFSYGM